MKINLSPNLLYSQVSSGHSDVSSEECRIREKDALLSTSQGHRTSWPSNTDPASLPTTTKEPIRVMTSPTRSLNCHRANLPHAAKMNK